MTLPRNIRSGTQPFQLPTPTANEPRREAGDVRGFGPKNPKRHDFAQGQIGNRDVAVMDERMMDKGWGESVPPPGKYGVVTGIARDEAKALGVDPANFQEGVWAGDRPGQPNIQYLNDAIERTHRLTGMPRQQIAEGWVKGTVPLFALGAGLIGGGGMVDEILKQRALGGGSAAQ